MTTVTYVVLAVAALAFAYRLLTGPTLTDRVSAVGGLIAGGMGAIATNAAHSGTGAFVPTLVAIALVGPISNGMIARYIEVRAEDRRLAADAPADAEGGSSGAEAGSGGEP
jgi:multicomponent Na+:H+ antiporter subunit F